MKARGPFGWPRGVLSALLGGTGVAKAAANTVLAGPTSGPDAPLAPRALVAADIASLLPPGGVKNIAGRNGGLEVWQRGAGGSASFSLAAATPQYCADGWWVQNGANQATTVAQVAGLTSQSRSAMRIRRNSGQTGTGAMNTEFPLDADEAALLSGQVVTLSFTVAAGANWSPTSGTLQAVLYSGTGSAARRNSGVYTNEETKISAFVNLTPGGAATPVSFTATGALQAGTRQASILLTWTPTGTAGAADDVTIDDVQLEVSAVATSFDRRSFATELAACQRHYWKSFAYGTAPSQNAGINTGCISQLAIAAGPNVQLAFVRHPVQMRVAPTMTFFNPAAANAQMRDISTSSDCSGTGAGNVTADAFSVIAAGNAASAVTSHMQVHATADAGI